MDLDSAWSRPRHFGGFACFRKDYQSWDAPKPGERTFLAATALKIPLVKVSSIAARRISWGEFSRTQILIHRSFPRPAEEQDVTVRILEFKTA